MRLLRPQPIDEKRLSRRKQLIKIFFCHSKEPVEYENECNPMPHDSLRL